MGLKELFRVIRCYPKLDGGYVACKRVSISYRSFVVVNHELLCMHVPSLPLLCLLSCSPPMSYLAVHLRTTAAAAPLPFHPILV